MKKQNPTRKILRMFFICGRFIFPKRLAVSGMMLIVGVLMLLFAGSATAQRNIVLFVSDDHGLAPSVASVSDKSDKSDKFNEERRTKNEEPLPKPAFKLFLPPNCAAGMPPLPVRTANYRSGGILATELCGCVALPGLNRTERSDIFQSGSNP